MGMLRIVLASVLALFVINSAASAQTSTLAGRVVDPQGASVANAEITLLTSASQRVRATRSTADGSFAFDAVAPGEYVLLVRVPGFAESTQAARVGDQPATVNVSLQMAGVTEDITVQGAMTGTAATGKTNLPVRELPMTVHGVPSDVIQEQGANDLVVALQNVPGLYAFTNYGVYEGYTFRGFLDLFPSLANQLVDGVRHEGNRINTQLTNIERVEVLKGPSSALYGGGAIGATVNLIRKKPSAQPAYDFSVAAGSWKLGRGTFGGTTIRSASRSRHQSLGELGPTIRRTSTTHSTAIALPAMPGSRCSTPTSERLCRRAYFRTSRETGITARRSTSPSRSTTTSRSCMPAS